MIKVSFIISNFNGKNLLKGNLSKIIKAGQKWGGEFEIIIVDDASTDDSVNFLKKNYPLIKLILHKKNKRFAVSCNDGVSLAKGEIVILLNTDVVPEIDFLKPLLANFKDEKVFAVGCKEKSIFGGKIIYSGRALGIFKRGFLVHRRAENQNKKETLWVASGSAAYRKKIWKELGGLDTLYFPAYLEDLDISYRALKAGYKIVFEPKSVVFHQHETTNLQVFGKSAIKIAAFKNQTIFVWKNIIDFNLLIKHVFWLPYHLIFDTINSNGLFFIGFLRAFWQLPAILKSRNQVKKMFKFSDQIVLKNYV